jgi:hypothetical protein
MTERYLQIKIDFANKTFDSEKYRSEVSDVDDFVLFFL